MTFSEEAEHPSLILLDSVSTWGPHIIHSGTAELIVTKFCKNMSSVNLLRAMSSLILQYFNMCEVSNERLPSATELDKGEKIRELGHKMYLS